MSTLIEFFNNVTGLDVLSLGNNPIHFLIVVFGFVVVIGNVLLFADPV